MNNKKLYIRLTLMRALALLIGLSFNSRALSANSTWTESGTGEITWNNQLGLLSSAVDNQGTIAASAWVEYDVTALVTRNGTYTFALIADGTDGVTFSSCEGAAPPQLVVTVGP